MLRYSIDFLWHAYQERHLKRYFKVSLLHGEIVMNGSYHSSSLYWLDFTLIV